MNGRPFTHNSLRTILKNEKYIGIYSYKDEVRVEGGIPAIIDIETFNKVQKMLKLNKRAPAHKRSKSDYILTEKLFCGHCGKMMVGVSGTSKTGAKHHYYACSGKMIDRRRKNHGNVLPAGRCPKKNIRQKWIENLVINETRMLLFDDELIEFIVENTYQYYLEANSDTSYTDTLQANLKKIDAALANLLKAVEAGIFNATTKARMDELEEQRVQIAASLERAKLDTGLKLTRDHIRYFLLEFRDMNFEDANCQRRLIDTFINSIFVYDDRVTITFNYSGDNRTITLAEVDAAADGEKFTDCASCSTIMRRYKLFS